MGGKLPLKIVGDGPLAGWVRSAAERLPRVEWLGRKSSTEVYDLMGRAGMLIFPSEWYETFGRVAIEAYAKGTVVIAADIGAISELVDHGQTGRLFRPGDPEDLARQVDQVLTDPGELSRMRQNARARFEDEYAAERNYEMLMGIYEAARGR
jgi:glycosyltransferase involved in cell wall biosynthesis